MFVRGQRWNLNDSRLESSPRRRSELCSSLPSAVSEMAPGHQWQTFAACFEPREASLASFRLFPGHGIGEAPEVHYSLPQQGVERQEIQLTTFFLRPTMNCFAYVIKPVQ